MSGTERGRYLADLRRSNASGIHERTSPRGFLKRKAIQEELEPEVDNPASAINSKRGTLNYPEDDYEINGPSEEDLIAIDHEYSEVLDLHDYGLDYFPEDDYHENDYF